MGPRLSVPSKIRTAVAGRLLPSAKSPAMPKVLVSQDLSAKRPIRAPCEVTSFEAYCRHIDTMISVIPPFDCRTGYLPRGVHLAPWHEVIERFATNRHRKDLFGGLYLALSNLADAGCRSVLLDGSFVSSTPFPADYDAAWEADAVDSDRLDPILVDFSRRRPEMKAKYRGELFPSNREARLGIPFDKFFQVDRSGAPKGIVQLDLQVQR